MRLKQIKVAGAFVYLFLKLRDKEASWLKYLVVKAIIINKCISRIGLRRAGSRLEVLDERQSVFIVCCHIWHSALPYQYWHDAKHTTQYFMLFTSFDTVYTTIHQTYMFSNLIPCTKTRLKLCLKKHCKTIIYRSMNLKIILLSCLWAKLKSPSKSR